MRENVLLLELTDQEVLDRMDISQESQQEIPKLKKWISAETAMNKERWPNYQLRDQRIRLWFLIGLFHHNIDPLRLYKVVLIHQRIDDVPEGYEYSIIRYS